MPGAKGRSGGHNRKSTAAHKAAGTFRNDRHANKADDVEGPAMDLTPPGRLNEGAREVWQRVVETLQDNALRVVDQDALAAYCETVDIHNVIAPQFRADPLDKELRITWKEVSAVMDRLGRQFGWTPQARAAINVTPPEPEMTEFERKRLERERAKAS